MRSANHKASPPPIRIDKEGDPSYGAALQYGTEIVLSLVDPQENNACRGPKRPTTDRSVLCAPSPAPEFDRKARRPPLGTSRTRDATLAGPNGSH